MVFDLASDPGKQFSLMYKKLDMMFMFAPAFRAQTEYKLSTVKYPNIKPGKDFSRYENLKGRGHGGEAKVADWELHHHAG